jgi:hypothetical protein
LESSPIDPNRIAVGLHRSLGLVALTTEDDPGIEDELLRHAGFVTEPGEFVYTLPGNAHDAAAIRAALTTLRTSAGALGIRIGIDPDLAAALQQATAPQTEHNTWHDPAPPAPALTVTLPGPVARTAPRPHQVP